MKRQVPRWLRWLLIALLIVPLVVFYIRIEVVSRIQRQDQMRLDSIVTCLNDWGTLFSEGQKKIDGANEKRIKELDELVRAIPPQGGDRTAFEVQRQQYISASNAYDRAVEDNPGPPPPDHRCPTE